MYGKLHYNMGFKAFSIMSHNLWVIYISYWQFCFTVVIWFGSELKLIEELDTDGDAVLRTVSIFVNLTFNVAQIKIHVL